MRKLGTWIGVLGIVVVARAARAGEGGDTPLMVAAEIAPGVGLDGEDVRRVIAEELHRRIVAPALAPTVDAEDVLVVAINEARIVVSFHARSDERASRAITTPPDRAARLRAVAWLAGNLARDQVSPLVMAAAMTAPPKSAAPVAAAPPATPAVVEPPAAVAPPTETPAASAQSEALELRATPAERSTDDPTWTVTASAGPSMEYLALRHWNEYSQGSDFGQAAWQLEVQRRRLDGWILGAALDYGPSDGHGFGLAVTGGMEQRWRGFRLEESLGVGLESAYVRSVMTMVTDSSTAGESTQTTRSTSMSTTPYARLFATASHPIWHAWDVVARFGAHTILATTAEDTFFTASLGVRLRLP
jgi:hypothetical protein